MNFCSLSGPFSTRTIHKYIKFAFQKHYQICYLLSILKVDLCDLVFIVWIVVCKSVVMFFYFSLYAAFQQHFDWLAFKDFHWPSTTLTAFFLKIKMGLKDLKRVEENVEENIT